MRFLIVKMGKLSASTERPKTKSASASGVGANCPLTPDQALPLDPAGGFAPDPVIFYRARHGAVTFRYCELEPLLAVTQPRYDEHPCRRDTTAAWHLTTSVLNSSK